MKTALALLVLSVGISAAQTPVITDILNNYSLINSGIVAQGAIFIVKGSNLGDSTDNLLHSVPLQTTLFGVQIKITVSGVTTSAPMYYVLPQQVAGILPSNTPAGTGTLVVVNNGRSSSPTPITVVKSAVGVLTVDGTGSGSARVQDANQGYQEVSSTMPTVPGNILVFYGSGVGATRPGVDETVEQTGVNASGDLTNVSISVTIGSKPAQVLYRGRTAYPGLDQMNVQVPSLDASAYGCTVAVVIVTNGVPANAVTIPVVSSGSTCTSSSMSGGGNVDPNPTQAEINAWAAAGKYTVGGITLLSSAGYSVRDLSGGGTSTNVTRFNGFSGGFNRLSGPGLAAALMAPPGFTPSAGNCILLNASAPSYTLTPLDAGSSIKVDGPNGAQVATLFQLGIYVATVPSTYMVPGRYVFTGLGGRDVGAFSGTLDVSPELLWTNADAAKVITRANGVTVQWTGGDPTQLVTIEGQSTVSASESATFFCWANQSAGQFTVPASILSQLPASPVDGTQINRGSLVVYSYFATRLTAPGVDLFTASGEWAVSVTSQYK